MKEQDLPVAVGQRYLEDYPPGAVALYGPIVVDEAEVVDFARRYDPQPFHIDHAAAAKSPFGGLIASGWHTSAMMMRVLVDRFFSPVAGLGSPGIDELRWTAPVRPGDRLYVKVTVIDARHSASKPDRGLLRLETQVLKEDGTPAMTMKAMSFVKVRASAGPT